MLLLKIGQNALTILLHSADDVKLGENNNLIEEFIMKWQIFDSAPYQCFQTIEI